MELLAADAESTNQMAGVVISTKSNHTLQVIQQKILKSSKKLLSAMNKQMVQKVPFPRLRIRSQRLHELQTSIDLPQFQRASSVSFGKSLKGTCLRSKHTAAGT